MINQYRVFQIKEVHHQHWAKSYAQQVEDAYKKLAANEKST